MSLDMQQQNESVTPEDQTNIPSLTSVSSATSAGVQDEEILVGGAEDPKKENWKSILSTVLILIAAPLIALLLINFVFQSYEVDGPSMESTLQNQDRLIVDKLPKTISKITGNAYVPSRGQIIIFVKPGLSDFAGEGNKQLIKRVIGLPGDRVVVKDNTITVFNKKNPDGFQPDKQMDYGKNIAATPGNADLTVGENELFVCGDNRTNSLDSRSFGTISVNDVVGKLSFRIFPINKAERF